MNTTSGNPLTPTQVGSFTDWQIVARDNANSLGIRNGRLYSWGRNDYGVTGLGISSGNTLTPTQFGTAEDWVDITLGTTFSIAIKNS